MRWGDYRVVGLLDGVGVGEVLAALRHRRVDERADDEGDEADDEAEHEQQGASGHADGERRRQRGGEVTVAGRAFGWAMLGGAAR